jgi:hypothetical protein
MLDCSVGETPTDATETVALPLRQDFSATVLFKNALTPTVCRGEPSINSEIPQGRLKQEGNWSLWSGFSFSAPIGLAVPEELVIMCPGGWLGAIGATSRSDLRARR